MWQLKIMHNTVLRTNALFRIGTSLVIIVVNINKYPKDNLFPSAGWWMLENSWLLHFKISTYLIFYLNWQCKYYDPYFLLLRQKRLWHFFSCTTLGAFVRAGKFASSTKIPHEILTFLLEIPIWILVGRFKDLGIQRSTDNTIRVID